METTPYSISMSRERRGTATESTAEAYLYLGIVRSAFKSANNVQNTRVKEALAFLHDQESMDCTRFLLFALSVFEEADDEFVRRYDSFWATYGAISAEVLRRQGQTHIEIHPAEVSTRFAVKSNNAPWDIRERIIRGFVEVARKNRSRDMSFWAAAHTFLLHCQEGIKSDSRAVRASIEALVKFWEALAFTFGEATDVRQQLAAVAIPLLDLILEGHLTWSKGLSQWKDALFHLKLPVADPLQNEPLPLERDALIQKPLDKAAERISTLCRDQNHPLHAPLKGAQEPLVCYLHGLLQEGERAAPPDSYDQAEAIFRSGPTEVIKTVRIADICLRTGRGFRIEVDGISLEHFHDGDTSVSGDVEGRRTRLVDAFMEDQPQPVRIDSVDLRIPHPVGEQKAKVEEVFFPARVLRAWPLGKNRSGWALLAPQSSQVPDSWTSYVRSLTSIMRSKAA